MNAHIIKLSIFTTTLHLIETYLFGDFEYLIWLFLLILLDTGTGMLHAWKEKSFNSFEFGKVIVKVLLYIVALITVNVLQNFKIGGEPVAVFGWIDRFLLTAMILREAISVFENIGKIQPKLLPRWLTLHLKAIENKLEPHAPDTDRTD